MLAVSLAMPFVYTSAVNKSGPNQSYFSAFPVKLYVSDFVNDSTRLIGQYDSQISLWWYIGTSCCMGIDRKETRKCDFTFSR